MPLAVTMFTTIGGYMPRKKRITFETEEPNETNSRARLSHSPAGDEAQHNQSAAAASDIAIQDTSSHSATKNDLTDAESSAALPAAMDRPGADREEPPRNWGDPYKAIFTSKASGFEMGENRRFKQRVFIFSEKPDDSVIDTLKENGFTYRAAEKAWTIPANPDTRRLSEELAQKFAGQGRGMSR